MHALQSAYDFYLEKLKTQLRDVLNTKRVLNDLAQEMGLESPFPDEEAEVVAGVGVSIKIDEFVNKPPSTATQEYLAKRGQQNGAATWDAIKDALKRGGFDFGKYGGEKSVRMTLIKNTTALKFIRKQNAFGLKAWYPGEASKGKKKGASNQESTTPSNEEGETSIKFSTLLGNSLERKKQ